VSEHSAPGRDDRTQRRLGDLGHEVIAREIDVEDVGPVTARERPDVALGGLDESSTHALDLIDKIVREAACPVIVLLHARDPAFVKEGRHTLDETLSETDKINQSIREILDVQTEEWGVKVTVVELKDIQLPESMQRAMARQAEAEREKRAKIIAGEGEALAAGELGRASDVMMAHPLGAATAQPADDGGDRRRQELHDHVPGTADEHDRRARRVPEPREHGGGRPAGCGRAGAVQRRCTGASQTSAVISAALTSAPARRIARTAITTTDRR
jgi:chemotaxis response regulator CheB